MLKWEITGTVMCSGRVSALDLLRDVTQPCRLIWSVSQSVLNMLSLLSSVSELIHHLVFWGGDYPNKAFDLNHHGNSFLLLVPFEDQQQGQIESTGSHSDHSASQQIEDLPCLLHYLIPPVCVYNQGEIFWVPPHHPGIFKGSPCSYDTTSMLCQ